MFLVGMGWLAWKSFQPVRPVRSVKDTGLALLLVGLLLHFFLLFILPIVKAPDKLFQVPWPWMAMFHAMLAISWLTDVRQAVRREDVKWVVKVLAWLGIAIAAHLLVQRMNMDPLLWLIQANFPKFKWLAENHMVGLMGNPFQAAAGLAVLIPFISYRAFSQKGWAWKLCLPASLIVCGLCGSLSPLVAALIGSVLASSLINTKHGMLRFALLLLILLAGLFVWNPAILFDPGRLEIWKQSIQHIERHPILGVGLNQFKLLGITQTPNVTYSVRWAHNEWVHFATELGVFWTAGLAAYLLFQLKQLFRVHPAMFGCLGSVLILSIFHIPFHLAPTLAVTGICLSVIHIERSLV